MMISAFFRQQHNSETCENQKPIMPWWHTPELSGGIQDSDGHIGRRRRQIRQSNRLSPNEGTSQFRADQEHSGFFWIGNENERIQQIRLHTIVSRRRCRKTLAVKLDHESLSPEKDNRSHWPLPKRKRKQCHSFTVPETAVSAHI